MWGFIVLPCWSPWMNIFPTKQYTIKHYNQKTHKPLMRIDKGCISNANFVSSIYQDIPCFFHILLVCKSLWEVIHTWRTCHTIIKKCNRVDFAHILHVYITFTTCKPLTPKERRSFFLSGKKQSKEKNIHTWRLAQASFGWGFMASIQIRIPHYVKTTKGPSSCFSTSSTLPQTKMRIHSMAKLDRVLTMSTHKASSSSRLWKKNQAIVSHIVD